MIIDQWFHKLQGGQLFLWDYRINEMILKGQYSSLGHLP